MSIKDKEKEWEREREENEKIDRENCIVFKQGVSKHRVEQIEINDGSPHWFNIMIDGNQIINTLLKTMLSKAYINIFNIFIQNNWKYRLLTAEKEDDDLKYQFDFSFFPLFFLQKYHKQNKKILYYTWSEWWCLLKKKKNKTSP